MFNLELNHANQWACQAQMESHRMFEEVTTKSSFPSRESYIRLQWTLKNYGEFAVKRRKELDN